MIYHLKLKYWFPRILSVLFILYYFSMTINGSMCFGSQFCLEPGDGLGANVYILFIRNIPTIIFLIITFFSWKNSLFGFIANFLLALLLFLNVLVTSKINSGHIVLNSIIFLFQFVVPLLLISLFYLISRYKNHD